MKQSKQIILYITLFLFSYFSMAEECIKITDDSSLEDIVEAQKCVIKNLKILDESLKRYKDYERNVSQTLQDILAGQASCIHEQLTLKKNIEDAQLKKKVDYFIDVCKIAHNQKMIKFADVTEAYSRIKEKIKGATEYKESVELFNATIEDLKNLKQRGSQK